MSEVININHDTSTDLTDASNYTSTSGDGISITTTAKLADTINGLQIVVDDTTADYGVKTITTNTSGTVRARFYINLNGWVGANGDNTQIFTVKTEALQTVGNVRLSHGATADFIQGILVDNSGGNRSTLTIEISNSGEHYVEYYLISSATAVATIWVDGGDPQSTSQYDNTAKFANFANIWMGDCYRWAGTPSGTLFFDQLVVNDDGSEIGEYIAASSGAASLTLANFTMTASGSVVISGTTTWGHDTGVTETNIRNFTGNWTGTGTIEYSDDNERLSLNAGEYMVSEPVYTGSALMEIAQNSYQAGDTATLQYRMGSTLAECGTADYSNYTVPFTSAGYVQIKVTSSL